MLNVGNKQGEKVGDYKQENETLKAKLDIGKTCGFCPYYKYKSRCEKTIRKISLYRMDDITMETNRILDDLLKSLLNEGDEK